MCSHLLSSFFFAASRSAQCGDAQLGRSLITRINCGVGPISLIALPIRSVTFLEPRVPPSLSLRASLAFELPYQAPARRIRPKAFSPLARWSCASTARRRRP